MSEESIISLKNVNKWFGDFHVLQDVNLEVKKKERIVGKFRESASQWDEAVDTSDPDVIEKRSADLEAFIENMMEERAKMETMTIAGVRRRLPAELEQNVE